MKTHKILLIILFFQITGYCFSQGNLYLDVPAADETRTGDLAGTLFFSGVNTGISTFNIIHLAEHRSASSNAPFGIFLGAFQILYAFHLESNDPKLKTVNIISGS